MPREINYIKSDYNVCMAELVLKRQKQKEKQRDDAAGYYVARCIQAAYNYKPSIIH